MDNQVPSIMLLPEHTAQIGPSGTANIVVSDVALVSDNCAANASVTPQVFDCAYAGTTIMATVTATDASSNIAMRSVSIGRSHLSCPLAKSQAAGYGQHR